MTSLYTRQRTEGDRHLQSLLQKDEQFVRVAKIHEGIFWKGAFVFLLSLLLLVLAFNLGVFLMFVSLLILSIAYLTKHYLMLVLTDKRIMIRHGIIKLDVIQVNLSRIESVELEWTIPGRILGYATVVVTGTGSRFTAVPFVAAADAAALRSELNEMVFAREERLENK